MSNRVKLTCTDAQFEQMHVALGKLRKGSDVVKIDKQALQNLLIDHGRILGALGFDKYEQA